VARLTLAESPVGAWLDVVVDTVVLAAVVLGLGLAAQRVAGRGVGPGVVAAAGVALSAMLAAVAPPEAARPGTTRVLDGLCSRDGFYATLLAFIGLRVLAPAALPWLMGLVAVGSHAFWVTRAAALVRRRRAPPRRRGPKTVQRPK
jgi:phosphatidylglycerophosphate synthase